MVGDRQIVNDLPISVDIDPHAAVRGDDIPFRAVVYTIAVCSHNCAGCLIEKNTISVISDWSIPVNSHADVIPRNPDVLCMAAIDVDPDVIARDHIATG